MIKYSIFIIFGIILYLLLNTYNGFSIGVPNSYIVNQYNSDIINIFDDPVSGRRDNNMLGEVTYINHVIDTENPMNTYAQYRVIADDLHDAQIFFNYHENDILHDDHNYGDQLIESGNQDFQVDDRVQIYIPDYLQNIVNTVGGNPILVYVYHQIYKMVI